MRKDGTGPRSRWTRYYCLGRISKVVSLKTKFVRDSNEPCSVIVSSSSCVYYASRMLRHRATLVHMGNEYVT